MRNFLDTFETLKRSFISAFSIYMTVPLRILGNKEILEKSQIWIQTQLSDQSPFQKLNFGNSSQKTRKSRYQIFLVLSSFTEFFYFVTNILSRIVDILLGLKVLKESLQGGIYEKGALKNIVKFAGKLMCVGFSFSIKLQAGNLQLHQLETPGQVLFWGF